jgi:hypothetical protein
VNATIRFLQFDYNAGEEPKLRDLAARLGLRFEVLVGSGHPLKSPQPANEAEQVRKRLTNYSASRPHEQTGEVCPLIFEHVAVNAAGDVYECCAYGNYDVMKIGAYLDLPREEILMRRYTHPICNSCSWPRRAATTEELFRLHQAMDHRIGRGVPASGTRQSRPVA